MAWRDRIGRLGNGVHVALYQRADGRRYAKVKGLPVVLLTVDGRRTGTAHTTPIVYLGDRDEMIVAGSGGGQKSEPQWFRNLRRADSATVQLGAEHVDVDVRVTEGEERAALWKWIVGEAPFFAKYATRSGREIPLAVLTPRR